MSGVAIVRALLAAHPPVAALAGARVYAGVIPQGVALPAISVTGIGVREEETVARLSEFKMLRERVQVTVLTKDDYPMMKRLLKAAALGPGVHTGQVLQYQVRSIIPWGENPEIPVDDDRIYEQSRDFMVTFIEAN